MIIFDTETTDLMKPDVADIASQPHIVEIAMLKLDDKYKEIDRYSALLNPGVPFDDATHANITKLTSKDLEDCPLFLEVADEIADFFLGERLLIAHNLEFDRSCLVAELRRIGREHAFPYPPQQVCTVNRTKHLKGRRLKLTELYQMQLKKELKQTHRAMDDVESLTEIVIKMRIK